MKRKYEPVSVTNPEQSNIKMSRKKGGDVGTATIRTINQLIQDVDIIYYECGGKGPKEGQEESKLDEFQKAKRDLADIMKVTKSDMRTQQGIQERMGNNAESIKLKQKITKNLDEAKRLHSKLEEAYKRDQQRAEQGKSDSLDSEELSQRQELVALMKQDLEFTMTEHKPSTQQVSRGFQIAQQAREKRRQKREQGLMGGNSSEPQPLTAKQAAFIQESIERDKVLDEKLDVIKQGVQQLGQIAVDINEELDRQDVMLDEVDAKMDKVTEKLEARNKQMKKILEQTGGAQRWCPLIILFVILLALVGWIYQMLTK